MAFFSYIRKQTSLPGTALMLSAWALLCLATPAWAEMADLPVVKLQSLDKASARTMTFEARVGSTVKFGPIYIKIQACRKAPPIEQPESAAFLQIWEVTPKGESVWVYSGWMFASSPALSPMDHPIYDVWVLDCLERKSTDPVPEKPKAAELATDAVQGESKEDGEVTGAEAEPPAEVPAETGPKVEGPDIEGPKVDGPTVTFPGME